MHNSTLEIDAFKQLVALVGDETAPVLARETLRERLREAIVVDGNRIAYFSFLDDLINATPRGALTSVTPISDESSARYVELQREYDAQYLRVFRQPEPIVYTPLRIVR